MACIESIDVESKLLGGIKNMYVDSGVSCPHGFSKYIRME